MVSFPKLKELSFLVYGLGLSGRSAIKFFKKKKIKNFKIWDDSNKNFQKKYRAKNLEKTLKQVDYIVLSPGISILKNKKLRKFQKKIITDIDLFYLSKNRAKSIVVTGTNGKSTTCRLLAHLLQKNKFRVSLGGNFGTPILDLINAKKDFVIIEASSFQLSHSQFISPDFAFFLNFANDHLDWHGNKTCYLNSKLKIFQLQTKKNYAFINKKFKKIFIKRKFSSILVSPNYKQYKKIKFKIKNNYLTSKINDENMSFVYTFSKILKVNEKLFLNAIKSFVGLPHRFEIFLKKKNVTIINDSKATSFAATQTALASLKNIYWILGGLPKKDDRINVSKFKKNITKCYLIGKNINFFKNQLKNKIIFSITKSMKKTVIKIFKDIQLNKNTEKNILLSPSAASFDQFRNFEERGLEFKRLCRFYGKKYI